MSKVKASRQSLERGWGFLDAFEVPASSVKDRSAVFIRETTHNDRKTEVYIKIYANRKHPLQRVFRSGRSQREVGNLLFFQSLGIPTPQVIAWGERRNPFGRIVEEFIITESEKGTLQLDEFVRSFCPDPEQSEQQAMRRHIAKNLGEWTARIHAEAFIHEDLKWRNILVRPNGTTPELFWIDCPNGRFMKKGKALDRKKLKDCAALDKLAHLECTKEERKAFIAAYLGDSGNAGSVAKMCREVENYRRRRFDPKDRTQREGS
ncbi:hypothetical protein DDZ13_13715 [Coraliomargarita sinensis]|uniref:Non-specific serine/threonine protein kinase n=1 Tax=Coraliomargarita sinensis TaxID=2174842 RepID=A0A317ZDI2_9BACT|nr:lipopolysaccharide kinase InaA family protein [Coraliomargarita sinensis]PXA03120.1 hypothetical protein DDZ13_13715 [Coraliomargarita sinensis]